MTYQPTRPIKPSSKSPITLTWESITPTRASLWLKQTKESSFKQRNASAGVIQKYVHEMSSGNWHTATGDIIRLGICSGMEVVIDGQHRLQAIANSGQAQDMFVARNVPLEAFKYIDQGNNRSLKDVMDVAGWDHTSVLASAAQYLWRYEICGQPFASVRGVDAISPGTMFDWVEVHQPDLREVHAMHGAVIKASSKGIKMSESIMMFLFIRMAKSELKLAEVVFEYLKDPLDRTIDEPSLGFKFAVEYIGEMQDSMKEMRARGMKSRSDEHRDPCTAALILAWNSLVTGREFRTLKGFKTAMSKAEDKWKIL